MKLTVDSILERPGSDRKRLVEWFGSREFVRPRTLLRAKVLPIADRVWFVINLLDERSCRLWACDCMDRALKHELAVGRNPRPDSVIAIGVARRFARGRATPEELNAVLVAALARRAIAYRAARPFAGAAAGVVGPRAREAAWSAAEYTLSLDSAIENEWMLSHAMAFLPMRSE